MSATNPTAGDREFVGRALEAAIRIAVVAALVVWCYDIARPFLAPIMWGVIIAVATFPGYRALEARLGGRGKLAATLIAVLLLVALVIPSVLLADSLVDGARSLATRFQDGTLRVPPPPPSVAAWPLVGEPLSEFWSLASENLEEAVREAGPLLKNAGRWLVGMAAGAGLAVLQFVIAIVIAAVLLACSRSAAGVAHAVAERLAGERGIEFAEVAEGTVRNVARGILGVALLQGLLAGLGFLVAGVPAAGLLTVLCIVLGVVQIGIAPVTIPAAIWMFTAADTTTAVLFLAWVIVISPLDNVLKPILLGRGARVPMAVVFIGAIGGFIESGIIGLFVGAVVFSLGYMLFMAWVQHGAPQPAEPRPPD